MINIAGEFETKYLGFLDYNVRDPSGMVWRPIRPFTDTLKDSTVSDICFRSMGSYPYIAKEVLRIAAPNCRLTFAGDAGFCETISKMGRVLERRQRTATGNVEPEDITYHDYVVVSLNEQLAIKQLPSAFIPYRHVPLPF